MKVKWLSSSKFMIIVALLASGFVILSNSNSAAGISLDDSTTSPTAPLALNAIFKDDQVSLSWEPSQPGRFKLSFYNVFRKSAGDQDFQEIAQVEAASSTTYTDSQGKLGDHYMIEVTDDQDPSNTSPESDEAIAKEPPVIDESSSKRSSLPIIETVTTLQDIPSGVSQSEAKLPAVIQPTALAHVDLPQDNVNSRVVDQINHMGDVHVVQLEQAVRSSRSDLIPPALAQYKYEKQQLYQRFGALSQSDQDSAKNTCDQQTQELETSLLNLPESYQVNGLVALAYCNLIGSYP